MKQMECVFCGIVAGAAEAEIIWEDDLVLALMDAKPITDGHALVIPKQHSAGLADIVPSVASRMMEVAQVIATAVKESGIRCEGITLHLADGEAASQDVFHSHLHVIPRFPGDGFRMEAPWNGSSWDLVKQSASLIRATFEKTEGLRLEP